MSNFQVDNLLFEALHDPMLDGGEKKINLMFMRVAEKIRNLRCFRAIESALFDIVNRKREKEINPNDDDVNFNKRFTYFTHLLIHPFI